MKVGRKGRKLTNAVSVLLFQLAGGARKGLSRGSNRENAPRLWIQDGAVQGSVGREQEDCTRGCCVVWFDRRRHWRHRWGVHSHSLCWHGTSLEDSCWVQETVGAICKCEAGAGCLCAARATLSTRRLSCRHWLHPLAGCRYMQHWHRLVAQARGEAPRSPSVILPWSVSVALERYPFSCRQAREWSGEGWRGSTTPLNQAAEPLHASPQTHCHTGSTRTHLRRSPLPKHSQRNNKKGQSEKHEPGGNNASETAW